MLELELELSPSELLELVRLATVLELDELDWLDALNSPDVELLLDELLWLL